MACVWVHLGIVQFTFLPTSSPKEMDRDCMVQVWPSLRPYTKSKVQGVLNKPHYKERKMNTEFWISNTTTCSDLISPSPILISASLPRLSRRGMSSSVYLSHTPDWTTHYLTACHYSTSDWTTSAWTAQTMIGSLSISILMTFSYIYRKTICHNSLSTFFSHASSPPWLLLPRSFVWFHGEGHSTSHVCQAWGWLGVSLPKAAMTSLNPSPPRKSLRKMVNKEVLYSCDWVLWESDLLKPG